MPELPEVETMVRDLREQVVGSTITRAEVYWDRLVAHPDRLLFEQLLPGHFIESVTRRGKFALFGLSGGATWAVHRGMTGSIFLRASSDPEDRFVRARFALGNGQEMRFDDSRKFGRLYFVQQEDLGRYQPPWERLGPEPVEVDFDVRQFRAALSRRTAAIKTILLSQAVVAGVGNIYADESLFLAHIHPARSANSLSWPETKRLAAAISQVLQSAIDARGTSFSTYQDINGRAGSNQHRLNVFHRHGQPCPRCGSIVSRIVLSARGTHFCPRCQPEKRAKAYR